MDATLPILKSYSTLKLAGAAVGGMFAFVTMSEWTHNIGLAVLAQAFATVCAAYVINRPRYAAVRSQHELGLLDRLHMEREQATKFMMERIVQQNKLIAVLTMTKHAFAGENEALRFHVHLRGEMLKEKGVSFPEIRPANFKKLVREEDRARAEMIGMDPDAVDRMNDDGSGKEDLYDE